MKKKDLMSMIPTNGLYMFRTGEIFVTDEQFEKEKYKRYGTSLVGVKQMKEIRAYLRKKNAKLLKKKNEEERTNKRRDDSRGK